MWTTERKIFMAKTALATAICLTFICFAILPAGVQGSWWQKGKDLLQGISRSPGQNELTRGEIGAGLKEALRVGSENVIKQLGRTDGFNKDAAIHIPLPAKLESVKLALRQVGMAGLLDDLELKCNRAAEAATSKAGELFGQAIADMTINDVEAIYKGPKDSATRYLRSKMGPALKQRMRPVVDASLVEVGAIQVYDRAMGKYRSLPFVPDVKADLSDYVVEKGMDGIFYYLAKEEAAIRENPAKQTTVLLKRVFGVK